MRIILINALFFIGCIAVGVVIGLMLNAHVPASFRPIVGCVAGLGIYLALTSLFHKRVKLFPVAGQPMEHYVRAFCTAAEPPKINTVMQTLRQRGAEFIARVNDPSELDAPEWRQFELLYKPAKGAIVVECTRDEGEDSGAREECLEFIEEIVGSEDAPARDKVIEHLKRTRFIVCCELPGDCDEDGFAANGQLLEYFVDHCGAMLQADGEGFYERMDRAKILLPLEYR